MNLSYKRQKKDKQSSCENAVVPVAFGAVLAVIISLAILFALSLAAYFTGEPEKYYKILAILSFILGGFFAGYITAKKRGENSAIFGALGGIAYLFLVLLPSIFIKSSQSANLTSSLLSCVAAVVMATIGGFLGKKREKRSQKSKVKFKKFK